VSHDPLDNTTGRTAGTYNSRPKVPAARALNRCSHLRASNFIIRSTAWTKCKSYGPVLDSPIGARSYKRKRPSGSPGRFSLVGSSKRDRRPKLRTRTASRPIASERPLSRSKITAGYCCLGGTRVSESQSVAELVLEKRGGAPALGSGASHRFREPLVGIVDPRPLVSFIEQQTPEAQQLRPIVRPSGAKAAENIARHVAMMTRTRGASDGIPY
jgi:hypothetical protein